MGRLDDNSVEVYQFSFKVLFLFSLSIGIDSCM